MAPGRLLSRYKDCPNLRAFPPHTHAVSNHVVLSIHYPWYHTCTYVVYKRKQLQLNLITFTIDIIFVVVITSKLQNMGMRIQDFTKYIANACPTPSPAVGTNN